MCLWTHVSLKYGKLQLIYSSSLSLIYYRKKIMLAQESIDVIIKNISEVLIHPKYENSSNYNVALLKMDSNVTFTKHIKPICLPRKPVSYRDNRMTQFVMMIGQSQEKIFINENENEKYSVAAKIYSQR